MLQEDFHLSNQDLLLWADGELAPRRAAQVRQHLSACWTCRARMAELELQIADFVHLYRRELELTVPPVEGPRALLKARLAACMPSSGMGNIWFRRISQVFIAGALAAFLLAAFAIAIFHRHSAQVDVLLRAAAIPDINLTPGASRPITIQDACNANLSTDDPAVPDPLKWEVLKEYGLRNVSTDAYEIDYLVTPRLGGATDIRNLWPEPYLNTMWNARVKDALEERLHHLVCTRQLSLAVAQREISQNWIAAYKKYFHTDRPLQEHSEWRPSPQTLPVSKPRQIRS
jgi:hypothetical protein